MNPGGIAGRDTSRIRINGALAEVAFSSFGLAAYRLFLRCKGLPESQIRYDWESDTYTLVTPARFAPLLGVQGEPERGERLPLAGHLFDYQGYCVERALDMRRMALWLDTGLGKTAIYLEYTRQVVHLTGGRVLILAPLQVIPQIQQEAQRFYGQDLGIERIDSREGLAEWCKVPGAGAGICNYEKMIAGVLPELRYLAGLVADESSLLRSGGGVIKWNLIKSARGVEYKLSCTATPAPNDTMEYASQAAFLEKLRTEGEILWTFFTRDKRGDWRVKPHAREAFYAFMASWSIYLRNPKHFGFGDILATLPPPEILEYSVEITDTQRELMYGFLTKQHKGMFTDDRLGVQERSKLSQLAKGFLYETTSGKRRSIRVDSRKPALVADLVRADVADGRQVLVWTVFDEESAIIAEHLRGCSFSVASLDGSMSESARSDVLERFRRGDVQVLISKAQLVGFGMNFQFCRSMVFSGFDDSFERFYQAIRRAYRFGQTETVRVHVPYVPELEGMIFSNVRAKELAFLRDVEIQEENYRAALGVCR